MKANRTGLLFFLFVHVVVLVGCVSPLIFGEKTLGLLLSISMGCPIGLEIDLRNSYHIY